MKRKHSGGYMGKMRGSCELFEGRVVDNGSLSAVAILLSLAAISCDTEQSADITDKEVIEEVASLGYERDSIVVNGNVIVIEGDMIMYKDRLLNGEYDPQPQDAIADDQIYKGYRYANVVSAANVTNVKLAWSTGTWTTPSQTVKNAFINAAGDYNACRNATSSGASSRLYLSQNNTGYSVTVYMKSYETWPDGTSCPAEVPACAEIPANGRPGSRIWVKNSAITNNCPVWTTSGLANRARHELGHVFGFGHPRESGTTRIAETSACSRTASVCQDSPDYSTVMQSTVPLTQGTCATTITILQADDKASIRAIY